MAGQGREHATGAFLVAACLGVQSSVPPKLMRHLMCAMLQTPWSQMSLERYMHFFERWDAHQKARNKVRVCAQLLQTVTPVCLPGSTTNAAQVISNRR
jgi:hypothetical protein